MTTSQIPSMDVDLFRDEQLLDPYAVYDELRAAGPAVRLPVHGNAWAVAGYDHVRKVLKDHKTFSSAPNAGVEPYREDMAQTGAAGADGPQHSRMRSLAAEQLSPRALRGVRRRIEKRAAEYVDTLLERGTVDLVPELARPFPLEVAGDLIGLPREGREELLDLTTAVFNTFGPANQRTKEGIPLLKNTFEVLPKLLTRDNVLPDSWGAAYYKAVDEGRMEEAEVVTTLISFVFGSFETTINTATSALWLLSTHPEAWQALRADPRLADPAVGETLRLEPVTWFTARTATRDLNFHGVPFKKGDRVLLLLGAANRDPRHYPDPDRFDLSRYRPNDHMTFSHGIHVCPGARFARMETGALLTALARKVARLEPSAEPTRVLHNMLRGFTSLPTTLVPAP
ncbi:cytochrome P450 [Streptomyces ipomoeae]|uniref:cytochrome P450 n=1 Tax=Streptomyces ipomoeae TaxID=103232 RepID=UPI0011476121|nr:cytochrome P450 [Streptomyces ipomoeae]MDX2938471.1 cytochrome P450 [Streptomyces ipomoeae]TQE17105.1 cytochrome P450 [Streptomyces ipomoeae]